MRTSPNNSTDRTCRFAETDALGQPNHRAFVHLDYEGDHKPEHSVSRVPSGHHAGVAPAPRDLPAP